MHSCPWNETDKSSASFCSYLPQFTLGSYKDTLEMKAYVMYWNLYPNLYLIT